MAGGGGVDAARPNHSVPTTYSSAGSPAAAPKRTVPTFAEIKKLQQAAGADLKTCKAALVEHGCDFQAALASLQ